MKTSKHKTSPPKSIHEDALQRRPLRVGPQAPASQLQADESTHVDGINRLQEEADRSEVVQRAAILTIHDQDFKDQARKDKLKRATRAVGSQKPLAWFVVRQSDSPPRGILSISVESFDKVQPSDPIDVFGHSRDSMPSGINADDLAYWIFQVLQFEGEWQGSMRIFSCHAGDGNEYNVEMAREFSNYQPNLRGVGGARPQVELIPGKAAIFPITNYHGTIRIAKGVDFLDLVTEDQNFKHLHREASALKPRATRMTEDSQTIRDLLVNYFPPRDGKAFQRKNFPETIYTWWKANENRKRKSLMASDESKVTRWERLCASYLSSEKELRAKVYNTAVNKGWNVAEYDPKKKIWKQEKKPMIGSDPGQVPHISMIPKGS